jgi:hypothetical protein
MPATAWASSHPAIFAQISRPHPATGRELRMPYTLFISHSLAWGDELLVAQLCAQVQRRDGLACRVARRNWKVGPAAIIELEDAVQSADCILALLMNDGTAASYVNLELGIARRLGKPVVAIAEKSAHVAPLAEKATDLVMVSLDAPRECATGVFARLSTLAAERRIVVALSWIILATLAEIFVTRD